MNSGDTINTTSSQELEGGASPCELQDGTTLDLFGQVVAPASRLAAQESKKATAMSATYGRIGLGSSASIALQSSLESKLRERLPSAGGMKWPQIWKRKTTPSLRRYCQLAVSGKRTNGTDCGLWPTATAGDANRHPSIENTAKNITLNHAALWPTAQARDWKGPQGRSYKGEAQDLPGAAMLAMWPTPNAGDDRDRGRWKNPSIQRRVTMGKQINLSMIAQGSDGLTAQTGKQGQLNPAFVCWLMGYSTAHLSSMLSAMQLCQK